MSGYLKIFQAILLFLPYAIHC